jgi:1,4-alpha-glucan branching enzyme
MKRLVPFLLSALSFAFPSPAATKSAAFGATPYRSGSSSGVTFRVWAGAAASVSVAGSFNGWDPAATPLAHEGNGVWAADVPGAKPGDAYKFVLDGAWKKDPRALCVESSAPDANCIVYDHGAFDWGGAETVLGGTGGNRCIWRNDLVIYEMHVGSFAAEGKKGAAGTFFDAAERIPYLADLGVSAVQLMPCAEFPGDHSLGYNPADIFAIESAYGGPDGLKTFVKRAHENGIAVILDLVHNHYGPSDVTAWNYDGKSPSSHTGGMYFYNDARAATDWGDTRPDFGKEQVRAFIRDNALGLVENFHLDGFRWDSVWNIAWYHWNGTSGGDYWNEDGRSLLDDINTRIASSHPDFFRFAEDNAFDGDMNFEADGDMEFRNGIQWMATAYDDNARDMSSLARWLTDGSLSRIVHAESHDTCNAANGQHRLPRAIHGDEPQGYWATKRAFLANAVTLVAPAIPMVFAGSEYNEDWDFAAETPLRWRECAAANAGITRAYRDLIRLRRNLAGATPGFRDTGNAQCTLRDDDQKVVAVSRGQDLLLVVNFSCNDLTGRSIPFPASGTWHCLFNSDETKYSALFHGTGPAQGTSRAVAGGRAALDIGPYSLQIWSTSKGSDTPETASSVVFDPAAPREGDTLSITYRAGTGVLAGVSPVIAHLGENGWSPTYDLEMTAVEGTNGVWTLEHAITGGVRKITVCFTDGDTLWDSNGGADWSVSVKASGTAAIAIAKPAKSGKTATTANAAVAFSGTASKAVAVVWSNSATGESGKTAVADGAWNAGPVVLAEGTNVLFAAVANPNDGASDNMSSEIGNGSNGGNGFGAWQVSATENAGTWTDTANGWGFWANSGGLAEAARPFAAPLQPGDRVSFSWRHGGIDNGGSVGFGFVNDEGKHAMKFYFPGGRNAYVCGGAETNRAAGDWTNGTQNVVFELGEDWTYEMTVGEKTFSGKLAPLAEEEITKVRMWNHTAGSGDAANVYWKGLAVEGNPLLLPEVSATCTVIRSEGGTARVTASTPVWSAADGAFRVETDAADAAALLENIHIATNLDNRSWRWRPVTEGECRLADGGFLVTPPEGAHWAMYSFGTPQQ